LIAAGALEIVRLALQIHIRVPETMLISGDIQKEMS